MRAAATEKRLNSNARRAVVRQAASGKRSWGRPSRSKAAIDARRKLAEEVAAHLEILSQTQVLWQPENFDWGDHSCAVVSLNDEELLFDDMRNNFAHVF